MIYKLKLRKLKNLINRLLSLIGIGIEKNSRLKNLAVLPGLY